jgi:hypothetical protein
MTWAETGSVNVKSNEQVSKQNSCFRLTSIELFGGALSGRAAFTPANR